MNKRSTVVITDAGLRSRVCLIRVVKTVFFSKTGNRLFKTGLKQVVVYQNRKLNNLFCVCIHIYIYICVCVC